MDLFESLPGQINADEVFGYKTFDFIEFCFVPIPSSLQDLTQWDTFTQNMLTKLSHKLKHLKYSHCCVFVLQSELFNNVKLLIPDSKIAVAQIRPTPLLFPRSGPIAMLAG